MKKFCLFLILFLFLSINVQAKNVRFVQITDVRYAPESTDLKSIINEINNKNDIDFVVFTGDNLKKPDKQYLKSFISEVKKLKSRFYLIVGEHDVNKHKDLSKEQYYKIVKKQARKHKIDSPNYVFEKNGVVFIVVDGSKDVIPNGNGYYRDITLAWLQEQLNNNKDKNVILLQHFPLIPPIAKENYYTYRADAYLDLIKRNSNVKAVISGHFGVNSEKELDNVVHITTAPYPKYRIIDVMNADTDNISIWSELH